MNRKEYRTGNIITPPNRHYVFEEVTKGYRLDIGEAYLTIPVNETFSTRGRLSRNMGGARDEKTVGESLSEAEAADYRFYVINVGETRAYRERLIDSGEDIFVHEGVQYVPSQLGENHDLIVYPNGYAMEDSDDVDPENSLSLRYYRKRAIQEPVSKMEIREAVNQLVNAIETAVKEGS